LIQRGLQEYWREHCNYPLQDGLLMNLGPDCLECAFLYPATMEVKQCSFPVVGQFESSSEMKTDPLPLFH